MKIQLYNVYRVEGAKPHTTQSGKEVLVAKDKCFSEADALCKRLEKETGVKHCFGYSRLV